MKINHKKKYLHLKQKVQFMIKETGYLHAHSEVRAGLISLRIFNDITRINLRSNAGRSVCRVK